MVAIKFCAVVAIVTTLLPTINPDTLKAADEVAATLLIRIVAVLSVNTGVMLMLVIGLPTVNE